MITDGGTPRVQVNSPSPTDSMSRWQKHKCSKEDDHADEENADDQGPKPMLPYTSMFILSPTNR